MSPRELLEYAYALQVEATQLVEGERLREIY